jgi:hypothetical protein
LALSVGVPIARAQQLNSQQIQLIKDTAGTICNTVGAVKGQKTDFQIQGDVKAQLNGLIGKVVDVGGSTKGSLSREEFEGLTRDATATALEGDRGCRERVFNKMFDKLSAAAPAGLNVTASCGSVAIGGNVSGSTITAGSAQDSDCTPRSK